MVLSRQATTLHIVCALILPARIQARAGIGVYRSQKHAARRVHRASLAWHGGAAVARRGQGFVDQRTERVEHRPGIEFGAAGQLLGDACREGTAEDRQTPQQRALGRRQQFVARL